jgi:hypothetical protein
VQRWSPLLASLVKVDSGLSCGSIPRAPQLLGVGSEPCCGSISLALMPPPMVTAGLATEDAAWGSYKTSYAVEMAVGRFQRGGDGGRVLPA